MKSRTKQIETTATEAKRFGRSFFDDGSFRVEKTPSMAVKYDIYLFGEIEDAAQFTEAIEALDGANEGDIVIIHLSTNGGDCDATDTFLYSMQNSAARVIVRASGGVHSAGSMILLAADEFTLSPNFNCLVHNGSFGAVGKTSDVKAQTAFQGSFMDKLMKQTYEGFLEPAEIDALIAGKDFWFDSDSFMERIHKREKYFGRTVDTDEE